MVYLYASLRAVSDPPEYHTRVLLYIHVHISKLLELYTLEESAANKMDPPQFGFVRHRGTNTAIALSGSRCGCICKARGSATYMCSLDAEGAFDAIPHVILFQNKLLKPFLNTPGGCFISGIAVCQ